LARNIVPWITRDLQPFNGYLITMTLMGTKVYSASIFLNKEKNRDIHFLTFGRGTAKSGDVSNHHICCQKNCIL
jgi:hypothetical protein